MLAIAAANNETERIFMNTFLAETYISQNTTKIHAIM